MKNAWMAGLIAMALCALGLVPERAASTPQTLASGSMAVVIDVNGAIGPATSAYVEKAIGAAEKRGARLLILRMDTPGGLDTAMRAIVKAIIASRVPVVGFVAPSGARAASAGTYILYACHLAAMAPGTNLGAATPVQIGGLSGSGSAKKSGPDDEVADDGFGAGPTSSGDATKDKLVNDAVAYIRGLAQMRGRNAEWAEAAVRRAASLPAEEAVGLGVVNLLAKDLDDLLRQIDGRVVKTAAGELVLATAGVTLEDMAPDWHSRLLSVVGNPNIAYILMLLGIYGLIYELSNPGAVLPGTVGAVSLLLALYAFQLLPIDYAGVGLLALGLALMVAEAFAPSFGALGLGGVAAFVAGSLILFDTDVPGFGLSIPLVVTLALISAFLLFFIAAFALRSRRRRVVSGSEELIGAVGRALSGFPGEGSVHLHGEVWTAWSEDAIGPGEQVQVTGREGLTLLIVPKTTDKGA